MRPLMLPVAAAAVLVATLGLRAQQAPPANLVPMSAASLVAQPDRYLGQVVAVYATLETVLSRSVFILDQDAKTSQAAHVLVIAPTLAEAPKASTYVTVVGEVITLEPATLAAKARNYQLDLPPDVAAKYQGKVVVLAQQVWDTAMTDLAKFVPPPLSPEEKAFDATMKQVNPTLGEVRKGLEASDAAVVKTNGERLRTLFVETQTFFAARKTADAEGWAKEAVSLVDAITAQAGSGNWTGARESATKIQGLCQSCHAAHRERGEDGQYRVKR